MKKCMLLILAAACVLPLTVFAADVSVTADFLSAYVWRGQVCNDEPVFQPSIDVAGPYGLGFNLWANMDLTDNLDSVSPETGAKWSEVDFTASWTVPLGEGAPVGATVSGVYYAYPQSIDADGDYDVCAEIFGNCLLSPSIKAIHSLSGGSDWRVELGIGHDFSLLDTLTLSLGAQVCYAFDDWMANQYGEGCDGGFNDVKVSAGLNFEVTDAWSVGALLGYSSLLDSDVRDVDPYDHNDYVYGGLTTSYAF